MGLWVWRGSRRGSDLALRPAPDLCAPALRSPPDLHPLWPSSLHSPQPSSLRGGASNKPEPPPWNTGRGRLLTPEVQVHPPGVQVSPCHLPGEAPSQPGCSLPSACRTCHQRDGSLTVPPALCAGGPETQLGCWQESSGPDHGHGALEGHPSRGRCRTTGCARRK